MPNPHTCTFYCAPPEHCVAMVFGQHVTPETIAADVCSGALLPIYGIHFTRVVRKPEGDLLAGPSAIGWCHHNDCYLAFGTLDPDDPPRLQGEREDDDA